VGRKGFADKVGNYIESLS